MLNNILKSIKGAASALLENNSKKETKKPVAINKKVVDRSASKSSKSKSKIKVIRKTEDLPKYQEILKDKVAIPESKLSHYTILLLDESIDAVLILSSEQTMDLPVDNNYLALAKQCKDLGYKVRRAFATKDVIEIINERDETSKESFTEEEKGPVHDRLRDIFRAAKSHGSSDVHIEVRLGEANIYIRTDGDKTHYKQIKEDIATTIARVAYSSLGKDKDVTFNKRKPQDAKIDTVLDGENVSIRLATIPASGGFDMVLRILPAEAKEQEYESLENRGYSKEHVKLLEIANAIPVGVILVCGVTGSGKTTTLTTMINNKMVENENKLKAITIEDPPEVIMKNVTQAPVVRRKGEDSSNAFADLMRATLRCDPDILMPGEIRDKTTGSLLVSAVQSGHQVFTTLHAPSAIGSIDRMREIGIRSNILGSHDFISALVYQSLVPITCSECSISIDDFLSQTDSMSKEKKNELARRINAVSKSNSDYSTEKVRFKSAKGCESCDGKGITHREVIAEVIIPDAKMKKFFKDEDDHLAYEYYRKSGGKMIIDHGLEKMFDGRIDPRSLERKVGRIDMSEYSLAMMLEKIRTGINDESKSTTPKPDDTKSPKELKSSLNISENKESGKVVELRDNK